MSDTNTEYDVTFFDSAGTQQEVKLSLVDYREAEAKKITLTQLLNTRYKTDETKYGTVMEQFMQSSGMFLGVDRKYGHRPPTLQELWESKAELSSSITRPDGANSRNPAGRFFFPTVLLTVIEASLNEDESGFMGQLNRTVAQNLSLGSQKYEQVVMNLDGPRAGRSAPIGQLDEPQRILTLKTSDKTLTMPVFSMGIKISHQAVEACTLDQVAIAFREAMIEEQISSAEADFSGIVNGDVDSGQSALSSVTAASLDSSISSAGVISHKAWVKFIREGYKRRTIDFVLVSGFDTYLAIEGRTGRPTADTDRGRDERLNTIPILTLPGIPGGVEIIVFEDTSILGANTIVGLDSRKAIRKVTYAKAQYQAVQDFVLSRATTFRIDWSHRFEQFGYTQAFKKITLTT